VTYQRRCSPAEYAQIVVDQWKHYEVAYQFKLDACSIQSFAVLNVGRKTISNLNSVNSRATLINANWDKRSKQKWKDAGRSDS
jgi:hypothetical protein